MKTLHTLLMLLTLPGLAGCTDDRLSGGPIDGVVLNEVTQRILTGAIVVAKWRGNTSGNWHDLGSWYVESHSLCYHVATAVSDWEGRFHIPAWESSLREKGFHFNIGNHSRRLALYAYKPGYEFGMSKDNQLIQLKPFEGTASERMDNLTRTANNLSCGLGGDSEKSLRFFYRALYEEGKPLADTKEHLKWLSIWRSEAEGVPWSRVETPREVRIIVKPAPKAHFGRSAAALPMPRPPATGNDPRDEAATGRADQ